MVPSLIWIIDRLQPVAEARAAQAFAVGDAELGAVRGADDTAAVGREEAVGRPVERRADMRAGIHVDMHRIALADGEQAGEAARCAGGKPLEAPSGSSSSRQRARPLPPPPGGGV